MNRDKVKIVVHTKTGKKLTYYPTDWDTEAQAKQWWSRALSSPNEAVRFGRFTLPVANIDFVEFS